MKRITELDGLRGLAILFVFLHHALHFKLLWMGVDVFFVLSGFLITGILLSHKERPLGDYFGHFYNRRVRRILPPYLLTLILVSFVFGWVWVKNWYFYIGLMNFLRPVRREIPEYFTPLWSLAVEEQFYLIWPFCVYFLSEKHLKKVALLLILVPPILRGVFHFSEIWPVYMLTPFRMDLLASGAMLSLIYREDKERLRKYGPAVALVLIAVGLFGIVLLSKSGVTTYGNTRVGNVFVFESSLLIAVGMITWGLSGKFVALLNAAALRYVGQVSYTMYLIHISVLILLEHSFSVPVRAAVSFAIVLLFATISWFGLEQPILSFGTSRRRSVSPASPPIRSAE